MYFIRKINMHQLYMLCISNDIYAKELSMINKITHMIDDIRCDENESNVQSKYSF